MADRKQLQILKRGVRDWNEWRNKEQGVPQRRMPLIHVDLSGADLRRADLTEADLTDANLSGADISGAILRGTRLRGANLSFANLSKVDLRGAFFIRTFLLEANLKGANLGQTNFRGAYLDRANFSEARTDRTYFENVDLSTAKGLETITHSGPSTIGVDTIYRSKGKIPSEFLRGAGVAENFIEYMHSLVESALEYYSCFISYSGKDHEFASRIHDDLQANGVRCWFAPHRVQAGKKLYEQIDTAIQLHERLLLILSPDSIKSEWVKTEIAEARKREIKEGNRVLFPIKFNIPFDELQEWKCFDADRGKDSAREIREYYIPDFARLNDHNNYHEEFRKLLRDLKKDTRLQLAKF